MFPCCVLPATQKHVKTHETWELECKFFDAGPSETRMTKKQDAVKCRDQIVPVNVVPARGVDLHNGSLSFMR